MSPLVFKTHEDWPDDVAIQGVGVLPAHGKGGVPVTDAAAAMTELQQKDKLGVVKLDDDGAPVQLSGRGLTSAAKDWADKQQAIVAVDVKESELAQLQPVVGEERPSMEEAGATEFDRYYRGLVTVNTLDGPRGYEITPPGQVEAQEPPEAPTGAVVTVPGNASPEGGQS